MRIASLSVSSPATLPREEVWGHIDAWLEDTRTLRGQYFAWADIPANKVASGLASVLEDYRDDPFAMAVAAASFIYAQPAPTTNFVLHLRLRDGSSVAGVIAQATPDETAADISPDAALEPDNAADRATPASLGLVNPSATASSSAAREILEQASPPHPASAPSCSARTTRLHCEKPCSASMQLSRTRDQWSKCSCSAPCCCAGRWPSPIIAAKLRQPWPG